MATQDEIIRVLASMTDAERDQARRRANRADLDQKSAYLFNCGGGSQGRPTVPYDPNKTAVDYQELGRQQSEVVDLTTPLLQSQPHRQAMNDNSRMLLDMIAMPESE